MNPEQWLFREVAGISAMARADGEGAAIAARALVAKLDELPRGQRRRARRDLSSALKAMPLIADGVDPMVAGWLVNHPHKVHACEAAGVSKDELQSLVKLAPSQTEAFGELLRASVPALGLTLVKQLRVWAKLHGCSFIDAAIELGASEARREILGEDLGLFVLEQDTAALVIDGWLESVLEG